VTVPGWQDRWHQAYVDIVTPPLGSPIQPRGAPPEDPIQDGWTEVGKRNRQTMVDIPPAEYNIERVMAALDDADYEKMEEIRARVDAIVKDAQTAAALKPWYRQFCKRPCFHDEYLESFNRPNVQLVDTDGKGIERFTEKGFVVSGKEYEVDCVIMATGFESPYTSIDAQAEMKLIGENGLELCKSWEQGVRSYQGLFSVGFPNMFLMQILQGAYFAPNLTQNWDQLSRTIAAVTAAALKRKARKFSVLPQAQEAWIDLLLREGHPAAFDTECTPGYFNSEGKTPGIKEQLAVGYPDGAGPFFEFQKKWCASGPFEGLSFE
jgi:cyclohexanone monooxygenase